MLEVELDVFSGMPNPTWMLTESEERELLDRVMAQPTLMSSPDQDSGELGYRGMVVRLLKEDDGAWATARLSSTPALPSAFRIGGPATSDEGAQQWLLGTSEKIDTEVDDYLRAVVAGTLQAAPAATPEVEVVVPDEVTVEQTTADGSAGDAELAGVRMACWSNHLTGTNMRVWNVSSAIRWNNCYNFAANHRTNTFAQPGRRAGRLFKSMAYRDMAAALAADGWSHSCVAQRNLSIALVIWHERGRFRDFHFYRMVARSPQTIWGHKPGKTEARIVDASGLTITNPERANRWPYNLFYGYWYQDNARALVS